MGYERSKGHSGVGVGLVRYADDSGKTGGTTTHGPVKVGVLAFAHGGVEACGGDDVEFEDVCEQSKRWGDI